MEEYNIIGTEGTMTIISTIPTTLGDSNDDSQKWT